MATSILLNNELSRFEIYLDGELAGFAEFKLRDGKMALPHTEIDPKFGGQGLGSALIQYALDDAAIKKLLVAPYCPFVSKYIGKNPDKYLFLVPEADRAKFGL
ncbi:MAG: GNAT family N-acetyltransferase [Candidatus Nanopelagicaceae bacterium]